MSALTKGSLEPRHILPPFLRMPTEIILQIFRTLLPRKKGQKILSSCCRRLREIGLPVIFGALRLSTRRIVPRRGRSRENPALPLFRALAASPLRLHVRTLDASAQWQEPLPLQLVNLILDRFPNLTSFACEFNAASFLRIYETPRILRFHEGEQDLQKIWRTVMESGPLLRRDIPLLYLGRHCPLNSCFTLDAFTTEGDSFLSSTLAANVNFSYLNLTVDASIPIPPSPVISTVSLPSLHSINIAVEGNPTVKLLESVGAVATVQLPSKHFNLEFQTPHPFASSFGILGQIRPFKELAGVSEWEMLGSGIGEMSLDPRAWSVTHLALQLQRVEVPSPFLSSLGTALHRLVALSIWTPEDSPVLFWPADWNTVVEAFTHFPSLTSLYLPGSLTPYPTFQNWIACSDESFLTLERSRPDLHRLTVEAGGWWHVWKRLGLWINLTRVRALGPSLPEGCQIVVEGRRGHFDGRVVGVEGGRGLVGSLAWEIEDGTEGDAEWRRDLGRQFCEGRDDESPSKRCLACGGMGLEMDLLESARLCGDEEVERAFNDEWKTSWTEEDVKAELARERSDSTR